MLRSAETVVSKGGTQQGQQVAGELLRLGRSLGSHSRITTRVPPLRATISEPRGGLRGCCWPGGAAGRLGLGAYVRAVSACAVGGIAVAGRAVGRCVGPSMAPSRAHRPMRSLAGRRELAGKATRGPRDAALKLSCPTPRWLGGAGCVRRSPADCRKGSGLVVRGSTMPGSNMCHSQRPVGRLLSLYCCTSATPLCYTSPTYARYTKHGPIVHQRVTQQLKKGQGAVPCWLR
jgi:hypothetical protein